ncbi:aldo/keto reductase [Subtercola boreus]|uniref:Oxidoreductase n=1 Tax=Subtercola boreus TaxID=120213 RepID=A0A3E0W7W7_9MICO|nr:aldo/keto reductase [Subtercola boreus]RFA18121.1 oxidoreductase [Subtercola boreus]RFA18503.1 oxidoreductase [Subtercola boreus]RFA25031.1 oxidoreductase [Subtercola boreus]
MISFPNGTTVPSLGQGTWNMGDSPTIRGAEIDAIRTGVDLGLTVIDTAEMYGNGRSEELVGEAISGRRDDVFLVSKVLPSNASAKGTVEACHASLRRLGTDRLDLYLLHWRGRHPLEETVAAFEALVADGSIRAWGVSNLDTSDLQQLPPGCQTDQVLYNLSRRGPEFDLLPWTTSVGMPVMAYSPVEQGRLLDEPALADIARELGATPAQVALAWSMRNGSVLAIPKASTAQHVRENAAARDLHLSAADLKRLDDAFPPPVRSVPLEML